MTYCAQRSQILCEERTVRRSVYPIQPPNITQDGDREDR
jgi:hypothetical protein